MVEHQYQMATFKGRNSFSKTDPDATFMRMKEDPMNNGQLKPGYNLQIATSQQFILAYDLFPNPTDTRTLKPFMTTHRWLFEQAETVSADAGYGSQSNYEFLEDEFPDLTGLIPYNTYRKEQSKKWKNDPKKLANWHYEAADDYYIDSDGVRFNFSHHSCRKDRYGYHRYLKVYQAEKYTEDQVVIPEALTPKGHLRKISVNSDLEYYKAKQRDLLSNPTYERVYARRKVDVEPAFGHLKACLGFTRFHVRGIDGVKNEMGLALMAANLRKLNHKKRGGFIYLKNEFSSLWFSFRNYGFCHRLTILEGKDLFSNFTAQGKEYPLLEVIPQVAVGLIDRETILNEQQLANQDIVDDAIKSQLGELMESMKALRKKFNLKSPSDSDITLIAMTIYNLIVASKNPIHVIIDDPVARQTDLVQEVAAINPEYVIEVQTIIRDFMSDLKSTTRDQG